MKDEETEKEKQEKEEEEQEQAAGSEMIVINARSTNSTSVYSGPLSKFDPAGLHGSPMEREEFHPETVLEILPHHHRTPSASIEADTSTSFARVRTSSRRGM